MRLKITRVFTLVFSIILIGEVWASDFHANDESHRVVYVVTDSDGNPVSGQTVRLAVQRSQDGFFLDFNDNSFKSSGHTTRLVTMTYDTIGEYYYRVVSIDQAARVSNDIVCIISNDSATYGDQQAEVVAYSNIKTLIKTNR